MRGRAGGLRVREARPRHDLLRIRVRPRGAAAPGDPVRSAGASGPGAPRPVAPRPVEPAPQPAGEEVWGDGVRVTVKFPPRCSARESSELSLRSVREIKGEPVHNNEGEKENKLLSRFGGATRRKVVVILKGYKSEIQRVKNCFGNKLLESKVLKVRAQDFSLV